MTGTCFNMRMAGPPLPILDERDRLLPEVKDCMKRMADYKICVFTGHRTPKENMAMARYASEVGGHILLTHAAGHKAISLAGTVADCKEMIKRGAFIEVSIHWFSGATAIWPVNDPTDLTDWLKEMGSPEGIVMSTDLGQPTTMHPIEGYRVGIRMLLHAGISKEDMKIMFQKNALKALYLED